MSRGPTRRAPFAELGRPELTSSFDWRAVTKIMMLGGILAAATTGFWGGLSDRRGRVPLLAIATVGEICLALGTIA